MQGWIHIEGQNPFKWSSDFQLVVTADKIVWDNITYRVIERICIPQYPGEYHIYLRRV